MVQSLQYALVRIYSTKNSPVGIGFLVTDTHVLTCAHVVAQALAPDDWKAAASKSEAPAGTIALDFPLLELGKTPPAGTAEIVLWRAMDDTSLARTDIALLQIVGELPAGSAAVPLIDAIGTASHPFWAFGVPTGRDAGKWAKGEISLADSRGLVILSDDRDHGYAIQPGFSGGPLWDDSLLGVVGMVALEDTRPGVREALMVPAAILLEALRESLPALFPSPAKEFPRGGYAEPNDLSALISLLEKNLPPTPETAEKIAEAYRTCSRELPDPLPTESGSFSLATALADLSVMRPDFTNHLPLLNFISALTPAETAEEDRQKIEAITERIFGKARQSYDNLSKIEGAALAGALDDGLTPAQDEPESPEYFVQVRIMKSMQQPALFDLKILQFADVALHPEFSPHSPLEAEKKTLCELEDILKSSLRKQFIANIPAPAGKVLVEFFLPGKLLCSRVDNLLIMKAGQEIPLGKQYPVVVRSLDRVDPSQSDMEDLSEEDYVALWKARAAAFHKAPCENAIKWYDADPPENVWRKDILVETNVICLGLAYPLTFIPIGSAGKCAPAEADCVLQVCSLPNLLTICLYGGVQALLWVRLTLEEDHRKCLLDLLSTGDRRDHRELPRRVLNLRVDAPDQNLTHPGNAVSLLWDDPSRTWADPALRAAV